MSQIVERSAEWIYRGIWRRLVDWFQVPDGPPRLAIHARQGQLRVFPPSRRYLSYLKLYFWVGLVAIDAIILLGWVLIWNAQPIAGWLLAVPALVIAIVPDIIAYIAIHLRYDTIWYGVSDRGIFIRRGIWVITEHTITMENIQNISVAQGPIEQLYRIATVTIETAGAEAGEGHDAFRGGNQSIMVGLGNATEVRELILERVRASRSAGLGDERPGQPVSATGTGEWSHVDRELLVEIRDELQRCLPAK